MMNVLLPSVHVPRDTKGSFVSAFTKDYETRPGGAHLAFRTLEGRQEGESGHAETPPPNLKTQQIGKDCRRACNVT